jgi:hypothetical protein
MTEKKVYIWPTSIPENWKKIAGEDYFVHISKSNQAKNTLEFLQQTQKYILQIRGSIKESSSARRIKWPSKSKGQPLQMKKKLFEEEEDHENPRMKVIEPSHSPLLPSLSEKNIRDPKDLNKIQKLRRNHSNFSQPSNGGYLKFVNQHSDYSRASHDPPPDFLCLPKALKANLNRVFNSFRN